MVTSLNGSSVGGWFGRTITEKLLFAAAEPSLTVTVIVALPDWLNAGITCTVRFDPLPPNRTLASGIRTGFDEAALSVKLPTGLSASPIVKAMAGVGLFRFTVWLGIELMSGAEFVGTEFVGTR